MAEDTTPTTEPESESDVPTDTDVTAETQPTETASASSKIDSTVSADAGAEVRSARKVREGLVVSDKMDKTAVVAVIERVRHPKYGKFMMRTKKLYAHDETNNANIGDKVRVMETRPLSKSKRWRVVEIMERAK